MMTINWYTCRNFFACSVLCALMLPLLVHGHVAGVSYEEEKDGYLIDIGYTPEVLVAGNRVRFDFGLYSLSVPTAQDLFTDVWVRVTKDNEIYFSGNLAQPYFGPTAVNIKLVEPGVYDIYTRYHNESASVVDTSFTVTVASSTAVSKEKAPVPWGQMMLFVCILFVLGWGTWLGYSSWKQRR